MDIFLPVALSGLGVLAYGFAAQYIGTPLKLRSDAEIRLWSAGAVVPLGAMTYYSWKMVLGENVSSLLRIVGGALGTVSAAIAVLSALAVVLPGPFVRSASELTLKSRSGVPQVVFKGKG